VSVELDASELQALKARFEELCRREPSPPFGEMFDEPTCKKIGIFIGRLIIGRKQTPSKT
jgi:hypothetical protein